MQGVLGIAERGGRVVAGRIDEVSRESVNPYINKFIPWGSAISTDEHAAYRYLCGIAYEHGVVRHKRKEWKKGIHHTNTIEGYWSRLKNSIKGTPIHVSAKHLSKYGGEFSYRYNMRKARRLYLIVFWPASYCPLQKLRKILSMLRVLSRVRWILALLRAPRLAILRELRRHGLRVSGPSFFHQSFVYVVKAFRTEGAQN